MSTEQKPKRDRFTAELTPADRILIERMKKPLADQHLSVTDAQIVLGVFRRFAGATQAPKR